MMAASQPPEYVDDASYLQGIKKAQPFSGVSLLVLCPYVFWIHCSCTLVGQALGSHQLAACHISLSGSWGCQAASSANVSGIDLGSKAQGAQGLGGSLGGGCQVDEHQGLGIATQAGLQQVGEA